MSSSVSLLPTVEFLDAIAHTQWRTDADYIIAFSTVPAQFYSTTNSEWICLNSESELLSSRFGTALIESNFSYTRPESSPTLIASNEINIPDKQLNSARSLFLYRSDGETEEIIFNSNFSRNGRNQTTAPLLDCFSRECMSWFPSSSDYFIGFGSLAGSLTELIVSEDGVIINKSEEILSGLIEGSTQAIAHSSIQFTAATTETPFVLIQFGSDVEYIDIDNESTPDPNILFLFSTQENDSLVCFAYKYTAPQATSLTYDSIGTKVSFYQDIIII